MLQEAKEFFSGIISIYNESIDDRNKEIDWWLERITGAEKSLPLNPADFPTPELHALLSLKLMEVIQEEIEKDSEYILQLREAPLRRSLSVMGMRFDINFLRIVRWLA